MNSCQQQQNNDQSLVRIVNAAYSGPCSRALQFQGMQAAASHHEHLVHINRALLIAVTAAAAWDHVSHTRRAPGRSSGQSPRQE